MPMPKGHRQPLPDVIGLAFNWLTITGHADLDKYGQRLVAVTCRCGREKTLLLTAIRHVYERVVLFGQVPPHAFRPTRGATP